MAPTPKETQSLRFAKRHPPHTSTQNRETLFFRFPKLMCGGDENIPKLITNGSLNAWCMQREKPLNRSFVFEATLHTASESVSFDGFWMGARYPTALHSRKDFHHALPPVNKQSLFSRLQNVYRNGRGQPITIERFWMGTMVPNIGRSIKESGTFQALLAFLPLCRTEFIFAIRFSHEIQRKSELIRRRSRFVMCPEQNVFRTTESNFVAKRHVQCSRYGEKVAHFVWSHWSIFPFPLLRTENVLLHSSRYGYLRALHVKKCIQSSNVPRPMQGILWHAYVCASRVEAHPIKGECLYIGENEKF